MGKNGWEFKGETSKNTKSSAVIRIALASLLVLVGGWFGLERELRTLNGFLVGKAFGEKTLMIQVSNKSVRRASNTR